MSSSLIAANGHSPQGTAWYAVSVREFFSAIPWTGEALQAPVNQPTASSSETVAADSLNMLMSVNEFFKRFPWEGQPDIAAPLAPLTVQPDVPPRENDLTLDGFAELF